MDKREYQEKLQEINSLIAAENYEGAAQVADTIDWKRVRNVQTLVMVSEVYEALERYEDSKVLLLRAYRRSPLGRTVLYRLVECTIKLRQFDQAIEYYSEYVQAAPHDNNKYILKYKIYRARGSSLDEQIDILKEYLDQEYNEKWAYELARLQIQADRVQEGLATCDDLVLWFHSGKYVIRALELKKKYAPLTPKQQEIYDNRFNEEEDEEYEVSPASYLNEASSLAKAERAAAEQDEIKSELAADISHTARMEASKEELSRKAEEAHAEIDRKAAESERALAGKTVAADGAEEKFSSAEDVKAQAESDPVSEVPASSKEAAQEKTAKNDSGKSVFKKVAGFFSRDNSGKAEETASARREEAEGSAADATTADAILETAAIAGTAAEAVKETAQEAAAEAVKETAQEAAAEAVKETAQEAVAEAVEETAQEAAAEAVEETAREAAAEAEAVKETAQETAAEAVEETAQEAAAEADIVEETAEETAAAAKTVSEPEASTAKEAAFVTDADEAKDETAAQEPADTRSEEERQADMVRSMREIVSGVGPKDQLGEEEAVLEEAIEQSKEDQENAVAARGADMTFRVPASEASQKRTAGKLTIDDILLSMNDGGNRLREVTGSSVMSASEEARMTAQQQAQAKASSYDADYDESNPEIPKFLREDVREAKNTRELPVNEIAEADDAMRVSMGIDSREQAAAFAFAASAEPDKEAASQGQEPADSTQVKPEDDGAAAEAAALLDASRVSYTKEIAEAKTRRLPVEEIRKLHAAYMSDNSAAAEEAARNASQTAEKAADMAVAEALAADETLDMQLEEQSGARTGESTVIEPAQGDEDMKIAAAPGKMASSGSDGGFKADAVQEDPAEDAQEETGETAVREEYAQGEDAKADAKRGAVGEQVTREVPKSEPEPKVPAGRTYLKENQMDLFRGFTSIGNLSEQIAGAIWQAENRKDDRTSRSGNILILGAHGCGKTTIATGIAKAIAEDKGTHSVKMARIYAADLNRKDIAATIAKIAGGVLIVEEAGDLDDAIVDQLTTAMEFRTDGMIMILEDEQRYIHDLLMRHPRFTMKFTAQIYIPEYSADELVNFGRIYAESQDYVFSEKATEACLNRIEAAKKTSEAVSVTNMIELVDRAIKNANTFLRRIGSAKKRYDDQDRIILREKDFR